MPKKVIKLDVKVLDIGNKDGLRRLEVELKGDSSLFVTSDFCAEAGAVKELSHSIKEALRGAILSYIKSGSDFMRLAKEKCQKDLSKGVSRGQISESSTLA